MAQSVIVVVFQESASLSEALAARDALTASHLAAPDTGQWRSLGPRAWEADLFLPSADRPALSRTVSTALAGKGDAAILPAENRRKQLLVCDMDSTIIEQECLDELADYAGLKAEIAAITERAMAGELDFEAALTERVARLRDLSDATLATCYRERITLSPGARTLVQTMGALGARCLLVSGGFTTFTGPVAEAAGFHEHHANRLIIEDDKLTGDVAHPILGREAKEATLRTTASALGLSADDALAMGDGANDLAMIGSAGLGIAYRAKPVVAREADCAINATSLETALYFQGIHRDEFTS